MLLRPELNPQRTDLGAVDLAKRLVSPEPRQTGPQRPPRTATAVPPGRTDPDTAVADALEPTGPTVEVPSLEEPASNRDKAASSALGAPRLPPQDEILAMPIEVWEGEVRALDHQNNTMQVRLTPKMGTAVQHTGDIDLEWVSEQDRDLVRPGAVFYWTLYKETRRGTIINSQSLRFRRRPNWSKPQLKRLRSDAQELFKDAKYAKELT